MDKGEINKEILKILNYVYLNGKLPEITHDNSILVKEVEDNHCIYRGNVVKTAITANLYDKSKSEDQERWLVDSDLTYKIYGFTKKDIMKG